MTNHIPLSVLDHVNLSEGQTRPEAIAQALEAARLVDKLGFKRIWYSEHHNMDPMLSVSNPILIAQAAMVTENIRVGSGGLQLPNYAPLQIAEMFGTLAQSFPGRIDLGLGRASGADARTAQLLRRSNSDPQSFANTIMDLTGWFSAEGTAYSTPVSSIVGTGANIPILVLGSSETGASIAGQLGLPFAVGSHFSPNNNKEKIHLYRSTFTSTALTAQIDEPYAIAAIHVLVAPTDDEAHRLWTTTEQFMAQAQTGRHSALRPPVDPSTISSQDRAFVETIARVRAVGSPQTVKQKLQEFVRHSGADELIVVTYAYDPAHRKRSMEMLADLWF